MSRRAIDRRLDRAGHSIDQQPLAPDAIDGHYTQFLGTGDLPDNRRIAWAVLKRALCARRSGRVSFQASRGPLAGPPREQLFREATHSCDAARIAARLVIRTLVANGEDPSDPEFVAADLDVPQFGSVGLRMLGWPDQWVAPERTAQMQRVMKQHAHLLAGEPRGDAWRRDAATAISGFLRRGELPQRDDMRQCVLTFAEMLALYVHCFGHGGDELLDAFEAAANASASERDVALHRLGQILAQHTEEGHHART